MSRALMTSALLWVACTSPPSTLSVTLVRPPQALTPSESFIGAAPTGPPTVLGEFEPRWVRHHVDACLGRRHGGGRITLAFSHRVGMLHVEVERVKDVPSPVIECLRAAFTNVRVAPFVHGAAEVAREPWPDDYVVRVPLVFMPTPGYF